MAGPASALAVAERLAAAFDAGGIDYAIGGALALGVWGYTRDTADVDITAYVGMEDLERVFGAIQSLDADVERSACRWQLENWGHFEVFVDEVRVDVFIPDFRLYEWAYARRRQVQADIDGMALWFLSAEDTLLFKLLFFRDKDKVDIKTLLNVQRENLDVEYIRKALREVLDVEEAAEWFERAVHDALKI